MIGPGKYDKECEEILKSTKAAGCLLMIINGEKGSGFSCKLPSPPSLITQTVPMVLRQVADQLEADTRKETGENN